MDCDRIETLLGAHLDGELGPAEAAAVRAHLGECPECRSRLVTLGAVREAVRDLRPGRSEAGLEAVLERARAAPAPLAFRRRPAAGEGRDGRRNGLRWAGIAAGVALTVSAVWLAVDRRPEPPGAGAGDRTAPAAAPALEPLDARTSACLSPEECGPDAEPLWPPVSI